ncbi:MAG: hypothetical protein JXL81_00540 [Deltaproteobacteria bacterium]|nr:hypothetical protein [Deltaproteobacteria bacterium]
MSQKYPECPLYNHSNCKDYEHPKLCAIVRKDKVCLKKKQKPKLKKEINDVNEMSALKEVKEAEART